MITKTPYFLKLKREMQRATLEALIFASDEVLTPKTLFKLLILSENTFAPISDINQDDEESTPNEDAQATLESELKEKYKLPPNFFEDLIVEINQDLAETNRPYHIVEIAGGFQFSTRPEYGQTVKQFIQSRTKRKLTQAALESLSIVAYRQPVTKQEIEQIRGVNSSDVVNSLIEKNLIKIVGRKNTLGKPLLYGTTSEFLRIFGMKRLEDLPKPREFDELTGKESSPDFKGEQITFNIFDEPEEILQDKLDIDLNDLEGVDIEEEIE
jgi:segregation and condensation protein B